MGLIGNRTILDRLPLYQIGGTLASDIRSVQNWHCKENSDYLSSVPSGYFSGGAWLLPQISGDIAVRGDLSGISNFNFANLAGGVIIESLLDCLGQISSAGINALGNILNTSTGSGDINFAEGNLLAIISSNLDGVGTITSANLAALISATASLSGEGLISNADLQLVIEILASLTGIGIINNALSSASLNGESIINGTSSIVGEATLGINATSTLVGLGTIQSQLEGIASLISSIINTGSLSGGFNIAYGDMSATISSQSGQLTEEGIALAVWTALASQFSNPLTTGGKLNSAGSAGDPWSTILPGSYTGDQAGKLISDLETLLKQVKSLTAANL